MDTPDTDIARAKAWVDDARRIVVLTGAGISTDSGIPDFRGPQGVWTRNPTAEKQSTLQTYLADGEVLKAAWRSRLDSAAWQARPNRGHQALVDLERRGQLLALVTQNIDELHRIAGNSPDKIVEVHGTMRRAMCWDCQRRQPMEDVLARVRAGEEDPHCTVCGGILKSDTISFGQQLVPEVIDKAMRMAERADLLLAVGSTLQVYPAAGLVPAAREAGARVVIINAEPTGMDDLADLVLRGSIGDLLPRIIAPATS